MANDAQHAHRRSSQPASVLAPRQGEQPGNWREDDEAQPEEIAVLSR